jgi:hypothetical protein
MFLIYGKRLFGRVDKVQGVFMVATQFAHIWFIPLIPMASYIVFAGSEDGQGFRGVKMNLDAKSVLAAYVRAFLVIAGIVQLIRGIYTIQQHYRRFYEPPSLASGLYLILLSAIFFTAYVLSRKLLRASYKRALGLAAEAGVDRRYIDACFNVMPSGVAAPK